MTRPFQRAAVLVSLLAGCAGFAVAQPEPLFTAEAGARGVLRPAQAEVLGHLEALDAFAAAEIGRVNAEALAAGGEVALALPGRATLVLQPDRTERRGAADLSWFGRGADLGTTGSFVVRGEVVVGTVRHGGQLYSLRPLGEGLHALVRLDESGFRDHPPEWDAVEAAPAAPRAPEQGEAAGRGTPTITLIVPYTSQAVAEVGGVSAVEALVQLAEDETNQSYLNSNVGAAVAVVHTYQTGTPESSSLFTDVDDFRTSGDGRWDEVHALRDTYAADVAIMITGNAYSGYCGVASTIYASASLAFALASHPCATGYYTFGHELGHLQGARHNPETDGTTAPFAYGHGKYYTPADWRTVMSYNCPGGCTRLPYWSNPGVSYGGVPMGDTGTRHNQRVLGETAAAVAAFREEAAAPVTLTVTPTSPLPVVLARGDEVSFDATFSVGPSGPTVLEYWSEADLPNGATRGPLLGPSTLLVAPPQTVTLSFIQRVPNSAPAGGYTYRLLVSGPDGSLLGSDAFGATITAPLSAGTAERSGEAEWLAYDGEGRLLVPGTVTDLRPAAAGVQPAAASRQASGPAVAAYPNPFARRTTLSLSLEAATEARLAVFDVRGRELAVLLDGPLAAGPHAVTFGGADLPSGVYVWRLVAGGEVQTGRLTLLR